MRIGVPREIKTNENRVALQPVGAEVLTRDGHEVWVERAAGEGSGFADEAYTAAGARLVDGPDPIFAECEMIVKVKEPQPAEYERMRPGQIVFTYFHFAASRELTEGMMRSGAVAIAYETVEEPDGTLPLLVPMSEVAGRMAVQEGAKYLEKLMGGRGILLGGVPGTPPGEVVIIGGGVVGTNAAKIAAGMGARVTILDVSLDRLRYLEDVMPANVDCLFSDAHTIRELLTRADLLIGAVLLPGAKAPNLVTREDLGTMKDGAVVVDVAVDQGGCIETCRPTTHEDPVYVVDGVVHYCVANMPGAVPRTSTIALTNATLPYVRKIAYLGWREACRGNPSLLRGLNIVNGQVTYPGVAEAFDLPYQDPAEAVGG
ncbi:MAG TPA: alanine dehydrogenase [Gemmatimonadota bacterium]|nr:alanine dehydrogenase [Gemmatimonadota bacterium]